MYNEFEQILLRRKKMEKIILEGYQNQSFFVESYEINQPKAVVILVHGVAECASRYQHVATILNQAGMNVYIADHIGHGQNVETSALGHWEKGDFDGCVFNVHVLYQQKRKVFPTLPFFLLGHSMGSFMAQKYQYLYPNQFQGIILTGCAKADALFKFGHFFASLMAMLHKKTTRMPIIDRLSFGAFNKKFRPNQTNCDWLCKDKEICQWYQDTPYVGFVGTAGFYQEFYKNVSKIPNRKYKHVIDQDQPLLLLGGKEDMVSNRGKKLKKLARFYQKQSNQVQFYLFDHLRHEIFNEPEKQEVFDILIPWMEEHL